MTRRGRRALVLPEGRDRVRVVGDACRTHPVGGLGGVTTTLATPSAERDPGSTGSSLVPPQGDGPVVATDATGERVSARCWCHGITARPRRRSRRPHRGRSRRCVGAVVLRSRVHARSHLHTRRGGHSGDHRCPWGGDPRSDGDARPPQGGAAAVRPAPTTGTGTGTGTGRLPRTGRHGPRRAHGLRPGPSARALRSARLETGRDPAPDDRRRASGDTHHLPRRCPRWVPRTDRAAGTPVARVGRRIRTDPHVQRGTRRRSCTAASHDRSPTASGSSAPAAPRPTS